MDGIKSNRAGRIHRRDLSPINVDLVETLQEIERLERFYNMSSDEFVGSNGWDSRHLEMDAIDSIEWCFRLELLKVIVDREEEKRANRRT